MDGFSRARTRWTCSSFKSYDPSSNDTKSNHLHYINFFHDDFAIYGSTDNLSSDCLSWQMEEKKAYDLPDHTHELNANLISCVIANIT